MIDVNEHKYLCKIWGFHGGDYKECRFLECYAVWLLTRAIRPNTPEDGILHKHIVMNGRVAWLIKQRFQIGCWIYSLRLQVTTYYNHLKQFLRQHRWFTWMSFLNSFCSELVVPWIPLEPTGPNLIPGPAKHLGWLGSSELQLETSSLSWNSTHLWTAPWLLDCFSLFCWTAFYCSLLFCGLRGLA
jgi:hypothetical protein